MDIIDHGDEIEHRPVHGCLDRCGIRRQIAAFQNDSTNIRIILHHFDRHLDDFPLNQSRIETSFFQKDGIAEFGLILHSRQHQRHRHADRRVGDLNQEIQEFCKANYGVTFPMAEKVSVKGSDKHPLFHWLTSKSENGVMDADIKWNFTKFLLDPQGKLVAVFPSSVNPMSEDITKLLN